jgi:hypothetical protein
VQFLTTEIKKPGKTTYLDKEYICNRYYVSLPTTYINLDVKNKVGLSISEFHETNLEEFNTPAFKMHLVKFRIVEFKDLPPETL